MIEVIAVLVTKSRSPGISADVSMSASFPAPLSGTQRNHR